MKQLLIVKTGTAINDGVTSANNLDKLKDGAVAFLDNEGKPFTAKPTGNFSIALGRGNQLPFMIPEVDVKSLNVVKATSSAGSPMIATVTIPSTKEDVGFVIVKLGTVPHERRVNSFSIPGTGTAADDAKSLVAYYNARNEVMALPFTVTASGATLTITCTEVGAQYSVAGIGMPSTAVDVTLAKPAIGDKAYIQNLASQCAAGKGFTDTYRDGDTTIPGYPEPVEDTEYIVYTLRFAVGRASSKTRDEVVSQLVHIAVPKTSSVVGKLDTIFGLSSGTGTGSGN